LATFLQSSPQLALVYNHFTALSQTSLLRQVNKGAIFSINFRRLGSKPCSCGSYSCGVVVLPAFSAEALIQSSARTGPYSRGQKCTD